MNVLNGVQLCFFVCLFLSLLKRNNLKERCFPRRYLLKIFIDPTMTLTQKQRSSAMHPKVQVIKNFHINCHWLYWRLVATAHLKSGHYHKLMSWPGSFSLFLSNYIDTWRGSLIFNAASSIMLFTYKLIVWRQFFIPYFQVVHTSWTSVADAILIACGTYIFISWNYLLF